MSQSKRKIGEVLISMATPVLCISVRIAKDIANGYEPNLFSMFLYVFLLSEITFPFLFLREKKKLSVECVIGLTCLLIVIDQLAKVVVAGKGYFEIELIPRGFSLKPSRNIYHSAMLSFFKTETDVVIVILIKVFVMLILLLGLYFIFKKFKTEERISIPLILLCSGFFASLIDNLVWGYTLDFICFPFYTVIDVKDIYLFVGINLLNVFMLREYWNQKDLKR